MHSRYLLIPTLAVMAGVGVAQAADDLQIHGFVSQGYFLTKNNALFTPQSEDNGTFQFDEVGLNVVATPVDRLRVGIQIAAQDLGDSFNNKPTIDWAYGNYNFGEVLSHVDLNVTAGRLKMGHGLYNDYRDLDMTRSTVFLPMSVYNPRWRDFMLACNGFALNTHIKAGALGEFGVMGWIGNNSLDAKEGALHDTFIDAGIDGQTMGVQSVQGGNIDWTTPLDGLRLKYSLFNAAQFELVGTHVGPGGPGDFVPGSTQTFSMPNYWDNIFSVEYTWKDLTVAAEYQYNYLRSTIAGDFDTGFGVVPISSTSVSTTDATYISAAYRVFPKWEVVGGWQWSQAENSLTGKSKWYAWNAAVRYDVKEHWLIKAEYQWTHGTGLLRAAEQPDGTLEETWGYFALKTTFDF